MMTRYLGFVNSKEELNGYIISTEYISSSNFCFFHVACIAFKGPASTPQGPFPAKGCEACTL